ncbi:MAG: hypothetical protein M1840_005136 [Geoglossum simile]|nr:MAG: hypothetical protein M1840_005136 [Geoglossum simile]
MAAPDSASILNMTGVWGMNSTLSDPLDSLFRLQGIPWIIRQVIKFATVELAMTHTPSSRPPSIESEGEKETHINEGEASTIEVKQTVRPGGFDSTSTYILDWETREATVPIFGHVTVRARYTSFSSIEDAVLRERLEPTDGAEVAIEEIIRSAENGWESHAVWGFEEIDGKRHYTRNSVTEKGEERMSVRVVYDYLRDNDA